MIPHSLIILAAHKLKASFAVKRPGPDFLLLLILPTDNPRKGCRDQVADCSAGRAHLHTMSSPWFTVALPAGQRSHR
jgi:hypothetical protein